MATVTLRPNGARDSINFTFSGTEYAQVNDASDATFITATAGASVALALADMPAIPTTAQIKSVKVFYRRSSTSGTPLIGSRLYVGYPGGPYTVTSFGDKATGTISTFACATLTKSPSNKPWTLADVNNLTVMMFANANGRIQDVWADVVYNTAPTVAVTTPTGTFTTSVRPEINWTYTDTDGNAQERYRVKIFTAAQYGIGGFNPDTSPNTWDSGEVRSNATGVQLPVNLINGTTYRAYVKAADVGSNGRYSAWAFSGFTISVAVPATPTLAVAATAATNVTLTVGNLTSGNGVVVERSDDSGVTWNPVRGAYAWLAAGASLVVTDYEPPLNQATKYRAWSWNTDAFNNVFASAYSTVQTITVSNAVFRLKDPSVAGSQVTISLRDNLRVRSPRAEGIFDPLGSSVAVVLVDANPGGDRIALPLQFKTDSDWRTFMTLRATGHVLQLVTDTVDQWYVQLTDVPETETLMSSIRAAKPYRTLDLVGVEVAAPPDPAPAPGS